MNKTIRLIGSLLLCCALLLPALCTAETTAQQLGAPESYGSGVVTVTVPGDNPVIDGINPITG